MHLEIRRKLVTFFTFPDCLLYECINIYCPPCQSPRLGSMEHLVGSEERLRWEGERDRLLARIKELQVRLRSDNQGMF